MTKTEEKYFYRSAGAADLIDFINKIPANKLSQKIPDFLDELLINEDKGIQNLLSYSLINYLGEKEAGIIARHISSDKINIRNFAGELLIKIGAKAVPALIKYLVSVSDDDDLKFTIDILGMIGDSKAGDTLISVLLSAQNENVIVACIEALGNIKYEEAVDYIMMCYDKKDVYKMYVIEALSKIGSAKALEFLHNKYPDENEFTRLTMIETMGVIGDEETFFFLLSELNEREGAIVCTIMEAILKLKDKFGFDIPFDEKMKNAVIQTVFAADPDYKEVAVYLISLFHDREILDACLRIYGKDPELDSIIKHKFFDYQNYNLLELAALINEKPANLQPLLFLLQHVLDEFDRRERKIQNVEYRNLIDSITKCLEYPHEEIRKSAMSILFRLDTGIALMFLDIMVRDDNVWNRLHLLDLLADIDIEQTKDALSVLMKDDNEMVAEKSRSLLEFNYQTEKP